MRCDGSSRSGCRASRPIGCAVARPPGNRSPGNRLARRRLTFHPPAFRPLAFHPPHAAAPAGTPLVTSAHDGHRRVIAAADAAARALGLRPGLPLAQASARIPGLAVMEAEPDADAAALGRLAAWCLRYAPLTAPDPPDGVWIDATGAAHLVGGEAALLADLVERLQRAGFAARAAIADTPGAAHAVARYGEKDQKILPLPLREGGGGRGWCRGRTDARGAQPLPPPPSLKGRGVSHITHTPRIAHTPHTTIVPPGTTAPTLAPLPIRALRLPDDTVATLHRLGLTQIGQLMAAPRAPLTRRFGTALLRRLDQALGQVFEPIVPLDPPELISRRLPFVEPLFDRRSVRHRHRPADPLGLPPAGTRRPGRPPAGPAVRAHRRQRTGDPRRHRAAGARPRASRPAARRTAGTVDPGPGVEAMRLTLPLVGAIRPNPDDGDG